MLHASLLLPAISCALLLEAQCSSHSPSPSSPTSLFWLLLLPSHRLFLKHRPCHFVLPQCRPFFTTLVNRAAAAILPTPHHHHCHHCPTSEPEGHQPNPKPRNERINIWESTVIVRRYGADNTKNTAIAVHSPSPLHQSLQPQ